MAHPHPISFCNNLVFILTIWITLLKTSLLRPTLLLEKCVVTPHLEQNKAQILARCIGKALHRRPHLVFCCFLSPLLLPSSHTSHSPSIMYFLFRLCWFCFFGHTLQHMGSLFPNQLSNQSPWQSKCKVLSTEPAGKSLLILYLCLCCCHSLHTSSASWPFPSRLEHNFFHSFHSTPPPILLCSWLLLQHLSTEKKKKAQPQSWELCLIQWTFWGLKPGQKSLR